MTRSSWARLLLTVCATSAFVFCVEAVTKPVLHVEPAETAMARARIQEMEQAGNGRKLLQTSSTYPSNTAPLGTITPAGLLVYTPANCSYLDADDFGNFFADAYNNNSTKGIYLSVGNYTVGTQYPWKPWAMYMGCLGNTGRTARFEISFDGSILSLGDRDKALLGFDTCANVYVHGGVLTYTQDQLPFTQGTIVNIQPNYWTVLLDPGYPSDILLNDGQGHSCVLYDQAGKLVQNGTDFYSPLFQPAGNGYYNLQTGFYLPSAAVGQKVACRGDTNAQHMFFCNTCKNFRAVNMTVYSSNIFGVFEATASNSVYDNIDIIPDPRGINGIPPLLSSNADGIHSSLPFSGPQITNCNISNTGDDAIAVQGIYLMVAKVNGNTAVKNITIGSWACNDPSCLTVQIGNSMLMYSPKLQSLGSAVVKSITTTTNPGTITGQSQNAPAFNYDTAYYFTVTFTTFPTTWASSGGPDGFVTVPAHNGQGSNIINNTVGNNRARGIYYKGLNGQVTNNQVLGSAAVGILLAPDFYYLEADYNQNVLISRNYVNVTGTGIFVSALNASLLAPAYAGHNNVTLLSNTIQGAYHPVIIGSATKVNMTNNTILDGGCYPNLFGDILEGQSAFPKPLTYLSYVTASVFIRNTFNTANSQCTTYGNYSQPYVRGPGVVTTTFV